MENKPKKKTSAPDFKDAKCKPFYLEGGSTAVLLIHGFTGSPAHMLPLGEALNAAGYTVRGILLPGHAETVAAMSRTDWTEWLGASEKALKKLRDSHEKVVVGGLSMGGLIACRLAETHPVNGLLCYAPALKFRRAINKFAPVVKHLFPYMSWKTNDRLRDPGFMKEYNIGYLGLPVAKVEDLIALQKQTLPELSKIKCPALIVQSRFDEQVHRDVPKTLCEGISSSVREVMWLTKSPHVCTIGADHEEVFDRTIKFLRANVG
ncbi:MAG: alpha/beta fold hydrolase [Oscillospiraceae bacterium]|jgi:carboxylesterase|nr:alpha/beta fold hydrolase [Oscillospiraceae bacterium]